MSLPPPVLPPYEPDPGAIDPAVALLDWTTVTVPTAGDMNTEIRDRQNALLAPPAAGVSIKGANYTTSVSSGVWWNIYWDTVDFDNMGGAMFDRAPSVSDPMEYFKVPVTGIYRVNFCAQFILPPALGTWTTIAVGCGTSHTDPALNKLRATYWGFDDFSNTYWNPTVSGLIKANVNDRIYTMVYQDRGPGQIVHTDTSGYSRFSIEWVAQT